MPDGPANNTANEHSFGTVPALLLAVVAAVVAMVVRVLPVPGWNVTGALRGASGNSAIGWFDVQYPRVVCKHVAVIAMSVTGDASG